MTAVRIIGVVLLVGLAFAQTAKQSPGYPAYERANRLFGARKFQECMDLLDEALRRDPKLVPPLTLRAKLAMAIDRYDLASKDLETAIAADPSAWYALFLY